MNSPEQKDSIVDGATLEREILHIILLEQREEASKMEEATEAATTTDAFGQYFAEHQSLYEGIKAKFEALCKDVQEQYDVVMREMMSRACGDEKDDEDEDKIFAILARRHETKGILFGMRKNRATAKQLLATWHPKNVYHWMRQVSSSSATTIAP